MKLNTLQDLFLDELKDLYSAENQMLKNLPKMEKAASSEQLKEAFQQHLETTKRQLERLQNVFDQLGSKPAAKKCKGMEGLLAEGTEMMEQKAEPSVKDAGLIGAAQRIEHYEIAGYGCARTYARMLGNDEVADMLQQTLDEEAETDEALTRLAENLINKQALESDEQGEEDEEFETDEEEE